MRANLVVLMVVIFLVVAPIGPTLAQQQPITGGSGTEPDEEDRGRGWGPNTVLG